MPTNDVRCHASPQAAAARFWLWRPLPWRCAAKLGMGGGKVMPVGGDDGARQLTTNLRGTRCAKCGDGARSRRVSPCRSAKCADCAKQFVEARPTSLLTRAAS